jgi:hypothetical protein
MLKQGGYLVVRSAGSHGPFDLLAIGPTRIRAISIKSGSARLSPLERE